MSPLPREEATPPVTNTCLVRRLLHGVPSYPRGRRVRHPTHRTSRPASASTWTSASTRGHLAGRCLGAVDGRDGPDRGAARSPAMLTSPSAPATTTPLATAARPATSPVEDRLLDILAGDDEHQRARGSARPRRSGQQAGALQARAQRGDLGRLHRRRAFVVATARPKSWPIRSYVVASAVTTSGTELARPAGCRGCRRGSSRRGRPGLGAVVGRDHLRAGRLRPGR